MTTTQDTSSPGRSRARLLTVIVTALAVLAVAEWASSRAVTVAPADADPATQRPENLLIVLKDPAKLPAPKGRPSLWIMGNSHTYALPGMQRGDELRTDEHGILLDELAARAEEKAVSPGQVDFYLLAYPNFLPFEMLTRVGHLIYRGHRPSVVFIGLTWRNIARDSQLRHEIYRAYRDGAFAAAMEAMLAESDIKADPQVIEQIHAQRARAERDEQVERLRSDSDRVDDLLTGWASSNLTLMGKSPELRAQLFRALTDRVQRLWDDRTTVKYSYDLVEHDFEFNLECLRAMIRLLRHNGATVICYYAPERSDLPPLMDPEKQNAFITQFDDEARELGVTVLDARPVVPNEYWGWVGDSPDRSHFTEPGHQRLARVLWEAAERQSVPRELTRP
jgi:hypothetical protein